jgi:uncharacterized membrane protein YvbJ
MGLAPPTRGVRFLLGEITMKKCPFCAEEVMDEAVKCKHCGSMLNREEKHLANPEESKKASSFSLLGMFGAFLAITGLVVGCTAGFSGNTVVAILGIVLMLVGAGLGAKYK